MIYIFIAGLAAMSQEDNVFLKKRKKQTIWATNESDTIFVSAHEKQISPAPRRFENLMMQRKENVHGRWRSVDDGGRKVGR